MGQSRPLFVYFRSFLITISIQIEKWCAWDSNPGLQDGRRRRNHGAMAATQVGHFTVPKHFCLYLDHSLKLHLIVYLFLRKSGA